MNTKFPSVRYLYIYYIPVPITGPFLNFVVNYHKKLYQHLLFRALGDFAVLVKAGMTVKQAITYNMVSAVISFVGMIVGILIGSNESSIVWVLALTAGMFLYISLVDMVSILKPN
jgi:ABC-type multidrug transport system fused ATPase/permease subunit